MTRFVLLEHDHPSPHFDLLFQVDDVLWAWRLEQIPADGVVMDAIRNFDHRLIYLDYEGPISGGRGQVRRLDRGELVWLMREPGRAVVELSGELLRGHIDLVQKADVLWQLVYRAGEQSRARQ